MANMPGGEARKLSEDIQLVQNRIERCIRHYMNKNEVMHTLIVQDNIEPHLTELVWQKLQERNPKFFEAYYLKLLVKDQILEFNRLLSEQVQLIQAVELSGIDPVLPPNGMHVAPTQHIPTTYTAQKGRHINPDGMLQPKLINNFGPAVGSSMQGTVVNGFVHNRNIDVFPNEFLSQNQNMGVVQTMNNGNNNNNIGIPEGGFVGSSTFDFTQNRNYVESQPLMDSSAHHINEAPLDAGVSSSNFLAQLEQGLSLLEFDDGLVAGSDLMDSYGDTPFLGAEATTFVDPHVNVESLDPESVSFLFNALA